MTILEHFLNITLRGDIFQNLKLRKENRAREPRSPKIIAFNKLLFI